MTGIAAPHLDPAGLARFADAMNALADCFRAAAATWAVQLGRLTRAFGLIRVPERRVDRARRQRVESLMRTYRRRAVRRARRDRRHAVLRSAHA